MKPHRSLLTATEELWTRGTGGRSWWGASPACTYTPEGLLRAKPLNFLPKTMPCPHAHVRPGGRAQAEMRAALRAASSIPQVLGTDQRQQNKYITFFWKYNLFNYFLFFFASHGIYLSSRTQMVLSRFEVLTCFFREEASCPHPLSWLASLWAPRPSAPGWKAAGFTKLKCRALLTKPFLSVFPLKVSKSSLSKPLCMEDKDRRS